MSKEEFKEIFYSCYILHNQVLFIFVNENYLLKILPLENNQIKIWN